ncbi:MAG: hypothetical protein O7F17_03510, partial [Planctomycetota bacterium]|nr:hypothetical protein [Planctomycetota bacterium]
MRLKRLSVLVAPALLAVVLAPTAQAAWSQTPDNGEPAATVRGDDDSPPANPPDMIRFNFKGATFDQVLDFFSRSTGLPVVKEADVPQGTLDFLAPKAYTLPEALRVLNIILQAKGVMLRASDEMLYLQKLTQMQREDIPTYVGELPDGIIPNQIITVVYPLKIAMAKPLAEKLAAMVAEYGSLTAMEQQNSLVITETAAQVRRLLKIVDELDREDPEDAIEIFAIRHAKAKDLMEPLKALLSRKVEKYITDPKGKQVKVEEQSMPGLNISFDERTNTIIAKGVQSRIEKLRETIALLDVPAAESGRSVRAFSLSRLAPQDAAEKLTQLYAKLPEDQRPTILPLDELGKVMLVGTESAIAEAASLLREIDGAAAEPAEPQRTIAVVAVEYADPDAITATVRSLLNDRQRAATKLLRGPDGKSLIVSGLINDVETVKTLVSVLDGPQETADLTIETFTPVSADPTVLAQTVRRIIESSRSGSRRSTLQLIAEPRAGAIVVIGTQAETQQAVDLLVQWDESTKTPPSMDLQLIVMRHSDAAVVARAANAMLQDRARWPKTLLAADRAGLTVSQPTVTADAAGNRVLISAASELMPIAAQLISQLDQPRGEAEAVDVRIFSLVQADATEVANALRSAMDVKAAHQPGRPRAAVSAEPSSNSLIVTATPTQLQHIESIIAGLDSTGPVDQLQVRTVFLRHARAESVAPVVEQLLAREELIDVNSLPSWARLGYLQVQQQRRESVPTVRVAADAKLNAVVIAAPAALLNVAEQMVAQLDVDPAEVGGAVKRSVGVLVVRNADASELATNLEAIFAEDTQLDATPTIRVDSASNSLLVLATEAQFETIRQLVGQIDRATIVTSRQMRMLPIDRSKASAEDLARTLQRLLDRGPAVEIISIDQLLHRRQPTEEEEEESPEPSSALPRPPQGVWSSIVVMTFAVVGDEEVEAQDDADDPDTSSGITIAVDPATNSLILVGPPRAIDRVADLARQLVEQIPAAPGKIRYIGLPLGADAQATARLVGQTLSQMTPPGGRRGDLRRRAAVISDQVNNALIVVCNDSDFEIVGDLIAAISQPPMTEQIVVKVYSLEKITADRAAASVRRMLDPGAPTRGGQAQRTRDLKIKLLLEEKSIEAVFDPDRVRVAGDPQTNTLIVMGPPEAIAFVDQVIELLDQAPLSVQTTLKLYPLQHAKAGELSATLRNVFRTRFFSMRSELGPGAIQPEFAADERTNTLLVTAAPEQLAEVDALLEQLDRKLGEDHYPLRMIELAAAQPQEAANILNRVVIGSDQARRATTLIVPDDATGVLLVRATEEVMAEIDEVLKEIDRRPTSEFKVRTIVLERADANAVASALQRLYDDRAKIASAGRGRREQARRVSIIGDTNSNTLLVAASDEDFDEITQLVEQFDTPAASQMLSFRVFELRHAKATEIEDTVQNLVSDLTWNQGPFFFFSSRFRAPQRRSQGTVAVRADARLNALIVTGEGDKFEVVEKLIEILDAPQPQGEQRLVKLYQLKHADVNIVADVIRETYTDTTRSRRWWEPPDPTEIKVRTDERSKVLLVFGSVKQHDEIGQLIASIDEQVAPADQSIAVLPVEFAQAQELAQTLKGFLRDRARATGAAPPTATIAASRSANTLIVSADADDLATIRDLLARLDQPDVSGGRVIEIVALAEGDAAEIARIVRQQFGRRGGQGVVVTPDVRTNSLIINSPQEQFAQTKALIERLDSPSANDETMIRTYTLKGARAEEAVRILTETLQLDERGETSGITIGLEDSEAPAVEVRAKIVADRRSNSLVITATRESFPVLEALIAQLDEVPAASPVEYRIIPLKHALAQDVSYTLRQFMRGRDDARLEPRIDYHRLENQLIIAATADQFKQIERIVAEMDQPSQKHRITDFVPLQFAQAEQVQEALSVFYGPLAYEADTPGKLNARIVADPATNSLVITADEAEWESIRALLSKLDSEEYDASLQLRVIPLIYADARSVAGAINDAFAAQLPRGPSRGVEPGSRRISQDDERREAPLPTVLVEAEEWVRASAEPLTNSLIVSASRSNIRKIEQIIEQLDVADYAKLPAPKLILVTAGSPQQLAESLTQIYEQTAGDRGRKSLRIVADAASNTIIVRAEDDEFRQIKALAEALQTEASQQGVSVHVLKLKSAPAARIASAITEAFAAKAGQAELPLSIQVDPAGNSLVIACTAAIFAEIETTVRQLDGLMPPAGHSIFIIELENISPDAAKSVIETIGLDKPQPADSVSRLVSEPIKVAVLRGRRAIVVVANPVDREVIVGLLKAIDAEPELAEAQVRVIRLRNAQAAALAQIINQMLSPADQQANTALARAVQEQVRRLSVRRDGLGEGDLRLDLTMPIRVIADASLNALVISSTADNIDALAEIVELFDQLPITDAVTVQLFPLQNIAADQFARIVGDMFAQGKKLGGVPGSQVRGVPGGMVGRALLDEIAISVDGRTNTVIVAGKEDAVALVEVLSKRLDSDVATGWVEPRIVPLRYADASDLAETLQAILVDGTASLPQASPIQRQVARLRMARMKENGGQVLESDVFQPMTRLVIRPEPKLGALILVGTPMNLEVVTELVKMLDVEAAAPGAVVRIYPINHASATRLATTITRLFDQQVQSGAIRADDRVIAQADERTNALVVATSPRSFVVLERLLETLDAELAPQLGEIRRIELKNASATRLASVIQQLMDARLERLREVEPETADLERATIVADPRTNSLVIAAGHGSYEVILRLAQELDASTLMDDALIEVLTMSSGNVERIAETINTIMARRYADLPAELRQSQQPLVLTDLRSNSLLVAANPEDMASIRGLVVRLEAAPVNPAVGLHVIALDTMRAELLAPRLQQLMRQRQQSLGAASTPSDRVSIEPDTASNSLIVAASSENLQAIRDLIGALTKAEAGAVGGGQVELIQLASSRAVDIVDLLGEMYVDEANRARGPNTVRVMADERLNAVLVNAPPADVGAIKHLVAQLDGARPAVVVEIKYIPLTSANALETVSLIQNVLSGRGIGARRGAKQAIVLKYLREVAVEQSDETGDRVTEMEVSAAIRESITLTPDLRTNTVIVSAPAAAMEMIERMIRDMDASSTGAQNIRIFKLQNADALAMAEILTDLFNLSRQGNLLVLRPRESTITEDEAGVEPGQAGTYAGLETTELTAVPDERQQLSITVDSRTNSLLVSGTPNYLDLVAQVVAELDSLEANEREVFVYQLRNAVAGEIARVISDFVEQEQRKLIGTFSVDQIGSAARLMEREITIVGDDNSNTVLVSASPRYMQRVRDMIAELDVDPPQVLIQVLLAEVTLDTTDEWGFDASFEAGPYRGDQLLVSGASALSSAFVSSLGVPNISVATSDFNLLLRALE